MSNDAAVAAFAEFQIENFEFTVVAVVVVIRIVVVVAHLM